MTSSAAATPHTVGDPTLSAVLAWWDEHARELAWRASRDPYAIWVSEVMSAQTSVVRAAEAWRRWMARWPTVEALATSSLADVLALWQGLGYPRRARDLHRAARIVAADGWPAELTELPGVGAYVASAIRCFAFEQPVLPLDVNTRRVLARRFPGGVDPRGDAWRVGQALMEFGQRVCAARPACERCPVRRGCALGEARGGAADSGRPAGGAGAPVDPAPRARRQAPYAGSLRARRGALLRAVIAAREIGLADADADAAAGLLADGLVRVEGDRILAPE